MVNKKGPAVGRLLAKKISAVTEILHNFLLLEEILPLNVGSVQLLQCYSSLPMCLNNIGIISIFLQREQTLTKTHAKLF